MKQFCQYKDYTINFVDCKWTYCSCTFFKDKAKCKHVCAIAVMNETCLPGFSESKFSIRNAYRSRALASIALNQLLLKSITEYKMMCFFYFFS